MSELDSSEVLRKIGRNVTNFQKLEGMLKALAALPNYSGSLEEIKQQRDKHLSSLEKKSFGLVVGELFEIAFPAADNAPQTDDPNSFEISFTIRSDVRDRLLKNLTSLVNERNDLIHHRLTKFDPNSARDCKELAMFLEDQYERLEPVFKEVTDLVEMVRVARIAAARAMKLELENHLDKPSTP